MTIRRSLTVTCLAAMAAGAVSTPPVIAADPDGVRVTPRFAHEMPNLPGKSLIAVEVVYPPGGVSEPHRHAASAFILAYVLTGSIRSQVEGEPVQVYHAGESWYELPGAHHVVSENASETEPASLLAVFVVDSGDAPLTTPDGP